MITIIEPDSWKDLQQKVAEILNECGFETIVEKKVNTARGQVEIDVYAEEEIKGRKYTIICECKYWKSAIPQTVIHGFRTVVNDLGCNIGYVITTSAYQKGAINNAEFTNIELLTWEDFQNKFFESWFEEFFTVTITNELDPLMTYTELLPPKWYYVMSPEDQAMYDSLNDEYQNLGFILTVLFSKYSRSTINRNIPKLPLIDLVKEIPDIQNKIPADILNERGYKEFLEKIIDFGKIAILKFQDLRDKYNETDDKK